MQLEGEWFAYTDWHPAITYTHRNRRSETEIFLLGSWEMCVDIVEVEQSGQKFS